MKVAGPTWRGRAIGSSYSGSNGIANFWQVVWKSQDRLRAARRPGIGGGQLSSDFFKGLKLLPIFSTSKMPGFLWIERIACRLIHIIDFSF
jgi:hypothetical protein